AGINGLPGFTGVVGCSYSPGLRRCIVSNSSKATFNGFYSDSHTALTDHQLPVFTIIGRSHYPFLAGRHEYTIPLCQIPNLYIYMFPGFSTVSGFIKAFISADENCTSGSFKNGVYLFFLKICKYRRPYTCSICFL